MRKIMLFFGIILLAFALHLPDLAAQCPMCRMSAESNLKAGGTEGRALNSGILYLLSLPYLAIMIVGFIWYRNRKKVEDNSSTSDQ